MYKYLNNIYNVYYTQNDCIIFSDNSHQCDIFLNEFDIICKIVLKITLIIFLMKLKTQAILKKSQYWFCKIPLSLKYLCYAKNKKFLFTNLFLYSCRIKSFKRFTFSFSIDSNDTEIVLCSF